MSYTPQVLVDGNGHPLIVFTQRTVVRGKRKGQMIYSAVAARDKDIELVELETLRRLRPLERRGEPYPPRRAASFWLNHDFRIVTMRARSVLRGLVARQKFIGMQPEK